MCTLKELLSKIGYNETHQQRAFVKLLIYRGCFNKPKALEDNRTFLLVNAILPIWEETRLNGELLQKIYPHQGTIVNDEIADKFLKVNFTSVINALIWLRDITQLKFLRSTFHLEGSNTNLVADPLINVARWNSKDLEELNSKTELCNIGKSLGLIEEVSWPVGTEYHHVFVHGGLESHVKERIDFIKPFKGKLYYGTGPRGLFNDEASLAAILAEWFMGPNLDKKLVEDKIRKVLDNNNTNEQKKNWLKGLDELKQEILLTLKEEKWPIGQGWYYKSEEVFDEDSKKDNRPKLEGWPVAMDMVEYLFKQHKDKSPKLYDDIELLQVLTTGKKGRVANTEDTIVAWHKRYGEALLEEAKKEKVPIVFVSGNKTLALKYQDITAKAALSNYPQYNIITVGAGAKQFSLYMAIDNLAKIIYTIVPGLIKQRRGEIKKNLYAHKEDLNEGKLSNEHVDLFLELADSYLQTENIYDYPKAAALYQYVKRILETNLERQLLEKAQNKIQEIKLKIQCIEKNFLSSIGQTDAKIKDIEKHKDKLKDLREEVKLKLDELNKIEVEQKEATKEILYQRATKVEEIYQWISNSLIGSEGILNCLIKDCIGELGPIPIIIKNGSKREVRYCILGMGSIALGTATPWSDIEHAILIESDLSQEEEKNIKDYFRKLSLLMYIKIVNFGETILPSISIKELNDYYSDNNEDRWFYDCITPRGISFDGEMSQACKSPLGRKGFRNYKDFELICTSKELADFQEDEDYKNDQELIQGLWHVVPIVGSENLINEYKEELQKYKDVFKKAAFEMLKKNNTLFNPITRVINLSKSDNILDVKKQIYRFPDRMIVGLGDCLGIKGKNSWEIVRGLGTNEERTKNLTLSLNTAVEIRLRTYVYHGAQKEDMSTIAEYNKKPIGLESRLTQQIFYLKNTKLLRKYYYITIALAIEIDDVQDLNVLDSMRSNKSNNLYRNDDEVKGYIDKEFGEYNKAIDRFKKVIGNYTNTNSILGWLYYKIKKYDEALPYFDADLKRQKELSPISSHVADCLWNLGKTYNKLHNSEANKYFKESTEIRAQLKRKDVKDFLRGKYQAEGKIPKFVYDDTPDISLDNIYVNLMLIKREEKKEQSTKEEKKDNESIRRDYEDINASKEEINLEKIFVSDTKKENGSLQDIQKVLIYGRAGVGKTTLCRHICYKWAKDEMWQDKFNYIFHIPLRGLAHRRWTENYNEVQLKDNLLACIVDSYCGGGVDILEKILKEDKVLVILDGYDEVVGERKGIFNRINEALNDLTSNDSNNVKILMTSRPNAVPNNVRIEFKEIENIGLKEVDVYKYINNYFSNVTQDEDQAIAIKTFIKENEHIREIMKTPINLFLLCLIWKEEDNLRHQGNITLTCLYERIIQWLSKRYLHKVRKKDLMSISDEGLDEECAQENNILERIAYKGMQKRQIIISKEIIKETEIDSKHLEAMKGLGLLTAIGKEKKVIDKDHEFIHLTFQEYFAAKYIAKILAGNDKEKIREIVRFIEEIKYERFYERMITFLSGMVNKQEGQAQRYFWHIMLNGTIGLTLKTQLLLFRCLNEVERDKIENVPEFKKLLELLSLYLQEGIDTLNKDTFKEICDYKQAVNILLNDKYIKLELKKIELTSIHASYNLALLAIANDAVLQLIMNKLLLLLKDKNVRKRVVDAIANIGEVKPKVITEEVIKRLLSLLNDADKDVRVNVAHVIANIGKVKPKVITEEVIKELLSLLNDADKDVRMNVAHVIDNIGKVKPKVITEEVIKGLLSLLNDANKDVRVNVAHAIANIGKVKPKVITEEVIKGLLSLLNDANKDWDVIRRAVDAIANIGAAKPEEVIKGLLSLLNDANKDWDVRSGAVDAIDKIGAAKPKEALQQLLPLLSDDNEDMKRSVVGVICKIGAAKPKIITGEVFTQLLHLLNDKDKYVRESVVEAIGKIGAVNSEAITREVFTQLLHLLNDKAWDVRRRVVDAISKIGAANPEAITGEVFTQLLHLLNDKDKYVRRSVVEVIDKIGAAKSKIITKEVFTQLLPLLNDKDWDVRRRVVDAISKIGAANPEEALQQLLPLLNSKELVIKSSVVEVIDKIGAVNSEAITREIFTQLLPLLNDKDWDVRRRIVDAISKIGAANPEEALQQLLPLLSDNNEDMKRSVVGVICKIGAAKSKIITREIFTQLLLLLNHKDEYVRRSIIEVIDKIGAVNSEAITREVFTQLLHLLNDKDKYVRRSVVEVIDKIGAAKSKIITKEVFTQLLPLLNDKDWDVRRRVVDAIDKIGAANPEEALQQLLPLLSDDNEDMKRSVVEAIGKIGVANPEEALQQLLPLLSDDNEDMKRSVVEAIGKIGAAKPKIITGEVFTQLLLLLNDKDEYVKRSVVEAIGKIGAAKPKIITGEVFTQLLPLLNNKNWDVRSKTVDTIDNIGTAKPEIITREVFIQLLHLLNDKDEYIRRSVVEAIGKIGAVNSEAITREVFTQLLPLLNDKDEYVKRSVVEAIGKIGAAKPEIITKEVFTQLLLLLNHKDEYVRRSIIEVIDKIGAANPKEALQQLLPLLSDDNKDWDVRRSWAVDAISKFPLKNLLSVCLNNVSIFKSKGLIQFLSRTLLTLEPKGLLIHSRQCELLQFIGNNENEKYKAAKIIFNVFYKYNVSYNMPTTFFEEAYNYKKPFNIQNVELVDTIIPTNSCLEKNCKSLIDIQYKLSALNFVISLVAYKRRIFLLIEGKSIFYTTILHRIEFVRRYSSREEILINSEIYIKYEELEAVFHKLLGTTPKETKLEKGKDYQAHTFVINSDKADELYEEVEQEKEFLLTNDEKLVEKENQTKKLNSFTWAKEKLEKYLEGEEREKLEKTNWTNFITIGGEMKEGMVAALELIEVKAENYNVLAINQNLVEYSKLLYEICEGKQNLNILSKYKEDSDTLILIAAMSLHPIDQSMVVKRNEIINTLCNQKIGLAAKDDMGNTVAYYAARHNERRVLKVLIDNGYYTKEVTNNAGANVLHTAVYYKSVDMLLDVLKGERNLDFSKQVKIGDKEFAPLELAVALGDIREMEKLWGINKRLKAVSSWCEKNLLNVAIEFKREDVLHYLLHTDKYTCSWEDVQNAYIYAGKVGNVGAMQVIEKAFRLEKYKEASQSGQNIEDNENTALHKAIEYEQIEVIKFLMRQRDITLTHIRNKDNKKPEQIAKKLLKIAKEQGDKIKEAHYNRMLNIIITLENELIDTQHIMPKVGEVPIRNLVLKGGGPKGLAFIGALEEFEKLQQEYNLGELERIAGTSAGAITAALLAVGYRAGELKEKLSKLSLTDLLDNPDKEVLLKLAKEQQKISELFKQKKEGKLLMLELINLLGTEKGLCPGEFFEKLMNSWIKEKTGKDNFTFGDLAEKVRKGEKGYKELYIVSLDILAKKEEDKLVIFNTEIEDYKDVKIADAVRASMSIPIVFKPKVIKYRDMQTGDYKEHECVDGGLLWNYPIDIFDKVKFRYTGLRGRGEEKPIYNEYTLGFSLYTPKEYQLEKDESLNKAGVSIKKEKEATAETMGSKILKGGFKFLFKTFTKERFEDIEKHLKEIKDEVIAKLAALLLNGEAITGTYWKESTEIRTIDISNCGIGLLDFDLKEEKKQELIDAGKEAVREKFAKSKKRKSEVEADEKSPEKAKKENTSLSSATMSSEKEVEDDMEIDNYNTNSQINVAPEVLNLIIRDSQQSETLGKSPEL